ncbi:MAG: hypothetical protein HY904_10475 [Deltaproteobacteria bacterium]|nr:hypothetical protein [Deltaproteobacteria bacterium]
MTPRKGRMAASTAACVVTSLWAAVTARADGAAPVDPAAQARVAPRLWRVEAPPEVTGRVRVLTAFGRPISLAEGYDDAGLSTRLVEHARRTQQQQGGVDRELLRRGVVLVVAAGMGAAGLTGVAAGGTLLVLGRISPQPPAVLRWFTEVPRMGPPLALGGLALLGAAVAAGVAGGILAGLYVVRPPPPDPALVDALGAGTAWDPADADEVVRVHNARQWAQAGVAPAPTAQTPPPAPVPRKPPRGTKGGRR